MNRREFLERGSIGAALLTAGAPLSSIAGAGEENTGAPKLEPYKYRIAFGAWLNDLRMRPLPLENWPAPQFDDESVESAIRAMDVQAEAGFDRLDVWGLFATYGWPPDIVSALDADRKHRIQSMSSRSTGARRESTSTPPRRPGWSS
jgi:hypothetical protein